MATARSVSPNGGVAKITTKKLSNGTTLRVYFYRDKKLYAQAVGKGKRGKAK